MWIRSCLSLCSRKCTAARDVPLCVCFLPSVGGYGVGPAAAHSRRILGIYSSEPAFGTALEYDFGLVPKGDGTQRPCKGAQRPCVCRGLRRRRIWRVGLVRRDFPTYLFLKSEFVFLDYGESKFLFYIDYLALMGLCIFIAHYGAKAIRKLRKKSEAQ